MKKKIIVSFFVSVIFLYSFATGDELKLITTEKHDFKAKINKIYQFHVERGVHIYDLEKFKNRKEYSTFVTHFDANWKIEIVILEIYGSNNILKKGEKINFVIHSPTYIRGPKYVTEVKLSLAVSYYEGDKLSLLLHSLAH